VNREHPLHGLATRFGAGEVARRYYHRPLDNLKATILEGGPLERRRTERGRADMIEAARTLRPLLPKEGPPQLDVSFLSGERYWYQTLFCLYSLQLCCEGQVAATIYDDGSLGEAHQALIRRAIPWIKFVLTAQIEAQLDRHLPTNLFPALRARRIAYPHLRKLTDIHPGRHGWTLVLDSDMLFFRSPTALLKWAVAPDRPCHMIDAERAYGYSKLLMRELGGCEEPDRVNVGICGLRSERIRWEALDFWCRATIEREGVSYLQEQALTALLLAGQPAIRLPADDYRVRPSASEGRNPTAVLHHYVAESKRAFFQYGWRRVVAAAKAAGIP
jgi:hypothetical protein